MATRVETGAAAARSDDRFFFVMAIVMALVLVAGFSVQLAAGRSSFHAPLLVHVHAFMFFGWTFFYVLQNGLIASGSVSLHRRLGWLGLFWASAMVAVGIAVTVVVVRRGAAPFFFPPLRFLLMNGLSVIMFGGLLAVAILLRRDSGWHRRLIYCGMALLTGPGFGRLLPMPFLIPWADWGIFAAIMIFPLAGVIADLRRTGAVHPAWWAGIAVMTCVQFLIGIVANSPAGLALYGLVTAGSPGAAVAPLAYPPFPPL
ncbi:MAG: hypothetical protein QM690_20665 [Sphingobium sp.]